MRALRLDAVAASPRLVDVPHPTAGAGDVVVPVLAAGLNPVDLKMAQNPSLAVPRVVGNEAVVLHAGVRCYAERTVTPHGSVAEHAVVDPDRLVPVPADVEDAAVLSVGIAGIAAWMSLHHVAGLRAGETVVVLGATGAVGQVAVQLARLAGARVVAVGRSQERLDRLVALGADATVVLGDGFAHRIRAATDDAADVVLDLVWGPPLEDALGATALGARLVCTGSAGTGDVTLAFDAIRGRRLLTYSNRLTDPEPKRRALVELLDLVRSGSLTLGPRSLPLAAAEEAWALQASSPGQKLVLTVGNVPA